jgi:hypothetical protein
MAVAGALLASGATNAAPGASLRFRDQAAEIDAATRLLSAYGVVTSTFRTIAHNKAVGGVPDSYHLLDRAIDLARRPGVTHLMIDAALRRAGFGLVESLDEHDHSHFAFASLMPASAAPAIPANPPAPPPKPLPRVAADEHGVLNIDLQDKAASATAASITPR